MGDYIFFGRDHFKIYCVIFLLGQGLEMFFSYFSSGMLVVIAAACFNSPGIIALCVGIYFINDPLYEFVHLLRGWNDHNRTMYLREVVDVPSRPQ